MLADHQGFDRRWYASSLQAVYVPTSADDAVACVQAALSTYGRDIRITSGRHCYEDFAYSGLARAIIDMSALNQIGFDPANGGYFIEAGCENWTVYRTLLNAYGKTLPAGSCYSVGAGGHITGGGYGLLSRLHGLTIDHLTAVDIVTWDAIGQQAQLNHVSATSPSAAERDLFWALQGAGCGNFGVILRYWFADLPDAPDQASLQVMAWDWPDLTQDSLGALIAHFAESISETPDTDFSMLKLNHIAAGQIGMVYQSVSGPGVSERDHRLAAEERGQRLRTALDRIVPSRPLKRLLGGHPGMMTTMPNSYTMNHLTYLEALQTLNGSGPNQFGKYKSAYMTKPAFTANQILAIWTYLQDVPAGVDLPDMAQTLLQIDSYGGAINKVDPAATAVPQRSSCMKLQYQTYWNNDSTPGQPSGNALGQAQSHRDWMRAFYYSMYVDTGGTPDPAKDPSGTVDGCYFNYPDSELGTNEQGDVDQALWLYFLDNYRNNPRNLVAVKRQWDPQNYFHHAQSLPVS